MEVEIYFQACENGALNIVKKYIRKGFDVNCKDSTGSTGLMKACANGHFSLAKLILDSNANLNLTDNYGRNALHYATESNQERISKLLLCYESLHGKIDTTQLTSISQLGARDNTLRTVCHEQTASEAKPKDCNYLSESKALRMQYEEHEDYVALKDKPSGAEARIFDILLRFDKMMLSDVESNDADNEVKGRVYTKPKKTKKKGKKKKSDSKKRKKK